MTMLFDERAKYSPGSLARRSQTESGWRQGGGVGSSRGYQLGAVSFGASVLFVSTTVLAQGWMPAMNSDMKCDRCGM